MAYRHILWAPGGDDVTTHFAIAGPDLKLFWEQLQQERGQGSRPHFAEPAENTRAGGHGFTPVGCGPAPPPAPPALVPTPLPTPHFALPPSPTCSGLMRPRAPPALAAG